MIRFLFPYTEMVNTLPISAWHYWYHILFRRSPIRLLSVLGQEMESGAQLELAFESKELRDVCENEAEAKRQLGDSVAEMLKHRLADLNAATSPGTL